MARVIFKHGLIPDRRFNHEALEMGMRVEREHTNQKSIAKQIAKAHLIEDPRYYRKLRRAGL